MITKLDDGRLQSTMEMGRGLDGHRVRRVRIFRTKHEAEAFERKCIIERNGVRVSDVTLGDFVEKVWLPEKEASLAKSSLKSYEQELRLRILPAFGRRKIADITRLDVQNMISKCETEKVAKKSRELLRNILNSAVQYGLAAVNVAAGRYNFPRAPATRKDRGWLTDFYRHREVLQLAQGSDVEKILLLGLCMGLRKGEILGARWDDLENGILHVSRNYVDGEIKATKTESSVRDVPVPEYALKRLESMRGEGYICGSDVPLSPSTAQNRLRRWVSANIPENVTLQTLRHSFASAALNAGVPIHVVSKLLGHTNIMTTYTRYVKTSNSDILHGIDTINSAFAGTERQEMAGQNQDLYENRR